MASSQSSFEKRRLDAIWRAHPQVVALSAAVDEYVSNLDSVEVTAESMTDAIGFANAWVREHGDLPNPGIKCD